MMELLEVFVQTREAGETLHAATRLHLAPPLVRSVLPWSVKLWSSVVSSLVSFSPQDCDLRLLDLSWRLRAVRALTQGSVSESGLLSLGRVTFRDSGVSGGVDMTGRAIAPSFYIIKY